MIRAKEGVFDSEAAGVVRAWDPPSPPVQEIRLGVDDLDPTMKAFLGDMRQAMTMDAYREFESFLLQQQSSEVRRARENMLAGEKAAFGGALSGKLMGSLDLGVFDPERIPIAIREKMRKDPDIALGTAMIRQPIKDLWFQVECVDPAQAGVLEQVLHPVWRKLMSDVTLAVVYGSFWGEKIFKRRRLIVERKTGARDEAETLFDDEAVVLDDVKPMHNSTIQLFLDPRTERLLRVRQEVSSMSGTRKIDLRPEKVLRFSNDMEFGNYFGRGRYINCYAPWYEGMLIEQFMMRYFERRGVPPVEVTYPAGKTKDPSGVAVDNSELALRLGGSIMESSVIAIPFRLHQDTKENTWKVRFVEAQQRGEMFVEILRHQSSRKFRGLFLPEETVTSGGESRSRSAAVRFDAFLMTEEGLVSDIEHEINTQMVRQIQEFNFPAEAIRPCYIRIGRLSLDRREIVREAFMEMIRTVRVLGREGMLLPRLLPSLEGMAKVLNVPMEELMQFFQQPDEREEPSKNNRGRRMADEDDAVRDIVLEVVQEELNRRGA